MILGTNSDILGIQVEYHACKEKLKMGMGIQPGHGEYYTSKYIMDMF